MRNARLSTIIIAITLIAIVVSAAPANAQMGVWRDINPNAYISPPANPQLNSIYMLSPNEGWAVGDSLPTTNTTTGLPAIFHYDGSTWNLVPAPKIPDFPSTQSAYNLTSITFGTPGNPISVNDGWAVGYNVSTSGTIGGACGTGLPVQTVTVGGTTLHSGTPGNDYINGEAIVASESGTLASIGVNVYATGSPPADAIVAIYSTLGTTFTGLLGQSASTPLTTGWNDIPVTGVTLVAGTTYYIAFNLDGTGTSIYYATPPPTNYFATQTYGTFPPTTGTLTSQPTVSYNMRITYGPATCAQALHWDGVTWRTETAGLTGPDSAQLWSAFMVSSTDVWAVGQDLTGTKGVFWHWTGVPGLGGGWNMPQAPVSAPLYSVFMVSSTEGWAVGAGGIIFHYFGGAWNTFTSPVSCAAPCSALRSVYMISPTEGWAVGDGGMIIHYSSGTWSGPVSPGTTSNNLFSVFMVSSTEGWAFGAAGTILHYSGGTWTALSPNLVPTSPVSLLNFNSGFFNSADDGWVVGTDGVVLHFDGVNYGTITSPTINNFTSISFGPPLTGPINPNDGWAVGNASVTTPYEPTIYHWNGFAWTKGVAIGTRNNLNSVFMINTGDVWTVGGGPQSTSSCSGPLCPVILHFTGGSWNTIASPPGSYLLKSIFMVSSAEGWAVGEQVPSCSPISITCYPTGILLHYTVSGGVGTWAIFPAPSSPATQPIHGLNSVFMLDENEGWAVGDNETILHYTVSGGIGTWNPVTVSGTPSLSPDANLTSIFMLSASSGWVVGGIQAGYSFSAGPVIIYWDGTKWEPVAAPSIPGGITPTGHTSAMLKSVFFSAPNDGWAVGFPGKNITTTLHWDGVSWRHVSLSPALLGQVPPILTSVYMTSETDGWIVGGSPNFNYCTTSPSTCYFSQARPAPTDLRPASQLVPSVSYKTPLSTMLRFAPYGGIFSTTSTSILVSTASTATVASTTTISSTIVPVCPPNVTISIKAVDNQGNPISGVNVLVTPPGFTSCLPSSLQAATNSQGLVTFTLPANWTYSVTLSKAGVSSTQSISPSSTGQVFSLSLSVSPGGLIPGFPLESILAGLLVGASTLVLLRRRRVLR